MARKKKHEEHVNHERWLVSYADFITLLFATFTALFAISNADLEKLKQLQDSVKIAFGGSNDGIYMDETLRMDPNALTEGGGGESGGGLSINIFPSDAGSPISSPTEIGEEGQSGSSLAEDITDGDGDYYESFFEPSGDAEDVGYAGDDDGYGMSEGFGPDDDDGLGDGESEDYQRNATTATPTPTPAPEGGAQSAGEGEGSGGGGFASGEGNATVQLHEELEKLLEDNDLKGRVDVRKESRGSVISLGETAFFALGRARVLPESKLQLGKIVRALQGKPYKIRIEGHTDNTPVSAGSRWSSNLQLSTVRAANVVEFMVNEYHFDPASLSAAGYGEAKPIADNTTADGRQKNRRIDIVILTGE